MSNVNYHKINEIISYYCTTKKKYNNHHKQQNNMERIELKVNF